MLKTATFDHAYKPFINPTQDFIDKIKELFTHFPVTNIYQFGATIFQAPGTGLICVIRAFDVFYPIIMSPHLDWMDNRMIILLNDSEKKKAWYTIFKRPVKGTMLIDNEVLTNTQKQELLDMESKGLNYFIDRSGYTPLFNQDGNQIFLHIDEMTSLLKLSHNCPAATINHWIVDLKAKEYYALSSLSKHYLR